MPTPDRVRDEPAPSRPLAGYTVVALEQAVAAPLATRHLADLGARVIKLERIEGGDFARDYDHAVNGVGSHFAWLNRGKESVALDLKTPQGREVVRRLLAQADVFVHNLGPGAIERLGLDPATLRAEHQSLVVVTLSGYGSGGPFEQRKAYDMLVQAESGLVSVTGTPETAVKTGVPAADIASGVYCAQGVLAALLRRERTGEGATLEVSMFEATAEWLGHPMYMQMYADRQLPRMGLSHPAIAPYDAFPTSDGHVLIGIQNDQGWATLMRDVLGRPDLVDHPSYATNLLRVANRETCDAAVAEQTRRFTTADLDTRLVTAGVPAAQVNDLAGLVNHPQLAARDRWREVGTEHGSIRALLPPVTFTDVEAAMGDVPALGQHTHQVLASFGFDESEVATLEAEHVVRQHDSSGPGH